MRTMKAAGMVVLGMLALGLAVMARMQADKETPSRPAGPHSEPGALAVSAAEQSAWLDEKLPNLLALMAASPEARARIAGSLAAIKAPPAPLTPLAAGLAAGDLERLSATVHAAVAGNPRYASVTKVRPKPSVAIMPGIHAVRVEIRYPAPPATDDLEPGPLTFHIWVCPDRETTLALFWCRRGGTSVLGDMPEAMKKSILDLKLYHASPEVAANENPPGESASWLFPKLIISVLLEKGHKPMPEDRLSFIRGNVIVEASTVEYFRDKTDREWMADTTLRECGPDVAAVQRAIDSGLMRIVGREAARGTGAHGGGAQASPVSTVPRPALMEVTAEEQSDWLDEIVPRLVAAMAASPDLSAKIEGPLAANKNATSPVTPAVAGLEKAELEQVSRSVHAAVVGNRRYRQTVKSQPQSVVTVMARTKIVRVKLTYPAPVASKCLQAGPLTIDVWTCPERKTALALFWLRRGGIYLLDTQSNDGLTRSIADSKFPDTELDTTAEKDPPGESAYRFNPSLAGSILLSKGQETMPADRISFIRGNVVVEASTVEFTQRHGEKEWLAWTLRQCAPDVLGVLRAIDRGLAVVRRTGGIPGDPQSDPIRSAPKPVITRSSAAEQSDWLDQTIPTLSGAIGTFVEAGAKIASPLRLYANPAPPSPLKPEIDGLTPEDLERLATLVDTAVASQPRYGLGARERPGSTVVVMNDTRIVRVEMTCPAPAASKDLALGPLTIDVWVCPYRETALSLFWLRKGGDRFLDTRPNDGSAYSFPDPTFPLKCSVLDARFHVTATDIAMDGALPGEAAYQFNPRPPIGLAPTKGPEPTPADRLSFLRGNVVVEASTVEYVWHEGQKAWRAVELARCVPDIVAVLNRIDAGLIRFGKDEDARGNE